MRSRVLGNSGLEVSEIGFGCGGIWGYPVFDENHAIKMIRRAIELGVNIFDTGASYSGGNAEPRLAKALANQDLDKIVIGTKTGSHLTSSGRLYKDFSPKSIYRQVEASRRRLNIDQIKILQLHAPNFSDLNNEVFDALDEMKHRGWIKLAGASCDGKKLRAAIDSGRLDLVMLTYNILHQKAEKDIVHAASKGMGVLIKSPMAHSLYSTRIWRIRSIADVWYLLRVLKNYRGELLRGRRFRFLANIEGLSEHHAALRFALHPDVSSLMIGTTKLDHLNHNVEAVSRSLPNWVDKKIRAIYVDMHD